VIAVVIKAAVVVAMMVAMVMMRAVDGVSWDYWEL
jgi:hypothetical protein